MTMGLLLLSFFVLIAGSILCLPLNSSGRRISLMGAGISVSGAVLAVIAAIKVLITGERVGIRIPWSMPFGTFNIGADPLSALFIIIISIGCAMAAVYGIGYLTSYSGKKHLGAAWCFYNLLFAGMLLIIMARNGLLFLMAWEAMSLSSFFLVMFEHEKKEVRHAGWMYLTAAHLGAACLLALFALLSGPGLDMDFDRLAAPAGPMAAGVLFILAVMGFGAKAGFFPLHVWLPEAHPVAPSHVSAVMSGVMIKTGIYGLLRIIPLLGPVQPWWGWTLLIIGAISGIIGVLYALCQKDLKRLLAYSSVENIGIICLGLGLWLTGVHFHRMDLAALGIFGALLHVCHHAVFKSLLFLGAGAIKQAVHTLDIDRLGGLQKQMPQTAIAFLIGAVAISGVPPLNGFVSEFLIFLGAFGAVGQVSPSGLVAGAGLTAILSLSMIGGLAAACFTKVYGIIFLGEPRSADTLSAKEAPGLIRYPMLALAGICVLLGLAAPVGVGLVAPAGIQLIGASALQPVHAAITAFVYPIVISGAAILIITGLLAGLRHLLLKRRTILQAPTWDCGYVLPTPRMQYTASSFSLPIINMFRSILRPREHIRMADGDFPVKADLRMHTVDFSLQYIFTPLFRSFEIVTGWLHELQQGRNQLYILYIAITVVLLLLLRLR